MSDMQRIDVLTERLAENAALSVVRELTLDDDAAVERKIYFPYFRFDAKCKVPALFGRKETVIPCLVDAINNVAATADPVAIDSTSVPAGSALPSDHSVDQAEREARRYLQHHLGRRLRTIADFGVELEALGIVHKAFWIVRSGSARVIVDSVTGQPQRLN